jgi:hypothetical protein
MSMRMLATVIWTQFWRPPESRSGSGPRAARASAATERNQARRPPVTALLSAAKPTRARWLVADSAREMLISLTTSSKLRPRTSRGIQGTWAGHRWEAGTRVQLCRLGRPRIRTGAHILSAAGASVSLALPSRDTAASRGACTLRWRD